MKLLLLSGSDHLCNLERPRKSLLLKKLEEEQPGFSEVIRPQNNPFSVLSKSKNNWIVEHHHIPFGGAVRLEADAKRKIIIFIRFINFT